MIGCFLRLSGNPPAKPSLSSQKHDSNPPSAHLLEPSFPLMVAKIKAVQIVETFSSMVDQRKTFEVGIVNGFESAQLKGFWSVSVLMI